MSRRAIGSRAAQIPRHTKTMTRHGSDTTFGASVCNLRRTWAGDLAAAWEAASLVATGGNSDLRRGDRPRDLCQQELGADPRVDRVVAVVGQPVQPSDRFVAFDVQLHLPAQGVQFENSLVAVVPSLPGRLTTLASVITMS